MCTRKRGFTLIELLVVIAIIAILAAILFPVLAAAKARAYVAACLSNEKQLGYAIQMYCNDSGGMMPFYVAPAPAPQGVNRLMWFKLLSPYMKPGMVYYDPALPDPAKYTGGQIDPESRAYGYGINWKNLCYGGHADPYHPPKLDAVPQPSTTLLLCDAYTLDAAGAEQGYPAVNEQVPSATDMHGHVGSEKRHHGTVDVLFCDVHVKTLPYSYVTAPYATKASSTNQDIWGHFDW